MLGRWRFALTPRWIGLHILTVALVVGMVLLGRWQLHVSEAKHFSPQNFGYAFQWWLFAAATLWLWTKLLRDAQREPDASHPAPAAAPPPEPVTYRRYVMPRSDEQPDTGGDEVQAQYNAYLARLAEQDAVREASR